MASFNRTWLIHRRIWHYGKHLSTNGRYLRTFNAIRCHDATLIKRARCIINGTFLDSGRARHSQHFERGLLFERWMMSYSSRTTGLDPSVLERNKYPRTHVRPWIFFMRRTFLGTSPMHEKAVLTKSWPVRCWRVPLPYLKLWRDNPRQKDASKQPCSLKVLVIHDKQNLHHDKVLFHMSGRTGIPRKPETAVLGGVEEFNRGISSWWPC